MSANLKIGRYVKSALGGLNVPVFPIGQDGSNQGASFQPPFVTYKRNAFSEESTKDCIYEGSVPVAIDVVARTYDEMVDILCQVQTALHNAPATWNAQSARPFTISDQSLTFGEEGMDDTMTLYVCEVTAQIETE